MEDNLKLHKILEEISRLLTRFSQLESLIVESNIAKEDNRREDENPNNEAKKHADQVNVLVAALSIIANKKPKENPITVTESPSLNDIPLDDINVFPQVEASRKKPSKQ